MDFLRKTWAEIDISALVHNFNAIKQSIAPSRLMAVVKANAYGHSAKDIAPVLEKQGADAFAVSNLTEALQLRECGITKPILILGYTPAEMAGLLCENDIIQCVFCTEYARQLSAAAEGLDTEIKIHIKLDTGMGRIGFDCRSDALTEIDEAIAASQLPGLRMCGIFTHFAESDRTPQSDDGFTEDQYRRFIAGIEKFRAAGINPGDCHCCNSAASLADIEKHLDYCRPGIILYGLTPSRELKLDRQLLPVMSFKTVVTMVKEIAAGQTVSYGRTFKADKKIKTATLAAGYADGYPRLLSNKGYVLIHGKKAPVIGRVCMDQISVDVSDIPDVKIGDEVLLFGKDLPVEELAELCGTINYEIVSNISVRVPRIVMGV